MDAKGSTAARMSSMQSSTTTNSKIMKIGGVPHKYSYLPTNVHGADKVLHGSHELAPTNTVACNVSDIPKTGPANATIDFVEKTQINAISDTVVAKTSVHYKHQCTPTMSTNADEESLINLLKSSLTRLESSKSAAAEIQQTRSEIHLDNEFRQRPLSDGNKSSNVNSAQTKSRQPGRFFTVMEARKYNNIDDRLGKLSKLETLNRTWDKWADHVDTDSMELGNSHKLTATLRSAQDINIHKVVANLKRSSSTNNNNLELAKPKLKKLDNTLPTNTTNKLNEYSKFNFDPPVSNMLKTANIVFSTTGNSSDTKDDIKKNPKFFNSNTVNPSTCKSTSVSKKVDSMKVVPSFLSKHKHKHIDSEERSQPDMCLQKIVKPDKNAFKKTQCESSKILDYIHRNERVGIEGKPSSNPVNNNTLELSNISGNSIQDIQISKTNVNSEKFSRSEVSGNSKKYFDKKEYDKRQEIPKYFSKHSTSTVIDSLKTSSVDIKTGKPQECVRYSDKYPKKKKLQVVTMAHDSTNSTEKSVNKDNITSPQSKSIDSDQIKQPENLCLSRIQIDNDSTVKTIIEKTFHGSKFRILPKSATSESRNTENKIAYEMQQLSHQKESSTTNLMTQSNNTVKPPRLSTDNFHMKQHKLCNTNNNSSPNCSSAKNVNDIPQMCLSESSKVKQNFSTNIYRTYKSKHQRNEPNRATPVKESKFIIKYTENKHDKFVKETQRSNFQGSNDSAYAQKSQTAMNQHDKPVSSKKCKEDSHFEKDKNCTFGSKHKKLLSPKESDLSLVNLQPHNKTNPCNKMKPFKIPKIKHDLSGNIQTEIKTHKTNAQDMNLTQMVETLKPLKIDMSITSKSVHKDEITTPVKTNRFIQSIVSTESEINGAEMTENTIVTESLDSKSENYVNHQLKRFETEGILGKLKECVTKKQYEKIARILDDSLDSIKNKDCGKLAKVKDKENPMDENIEKIKIPVNSSSRKGKDGLILEIKGETSDEKATRKLGSGNARLNDDRNKISVQKKNDTPILRKVFKRKKTDISKSKKRIKVIYSDSDGSDEENTFKPPSDKTTPKSIRRSSVDIAQSVSFEKCPSSNAEELQPETKITKIHRPNELDKLHSDIRNMFICEGVIRATGNRACTMVTKSKKNARKANNTSVIRATGNRACTMVTKCKKNAPKANNTSVDVSSKHDHIESVLYTKDFELIALNAKRMIPRVVLQKLVIADSMLEKKRLKKIPKFSLQVVNGEKVPLISETIGSKAEVINEEKTIKSRINLENKSKEKVYSNNHITVCSGYVNNDKAYFWNHLNNYKCKLCAFEGCNIGLHYAIEHGNSEVLISRLHPVEALKAINEFKTNCLTYKNLFDDKVLRHTYLCRFCHNVLTLSPVELVNHVTKHTGELRHGCGVCNFKTNMKKYISKHFKRQHKGQDITSTELHPIPKQIQPLIGYICSSCNFTQLMESNMDRHMKQTHKDLQTTVLKIVLCKLLDCNKANDQYINKINDTSVAKADNQDSSMGLVKNMNAFVMPEELINSSIPKKIFNYVEEELETSIVSNVSITDILKKKIEQANSEPLDIDANESSIFMSDQSSENKSEKISEHSKGNMLKTSVTDKTNAALEKECTIPIALPFKTSLGNSNVEVNASCTSLHNPIKPQSNQRTMQVAPTPLLVVSDQIDSEKSLVEAYIIQNEEDWDDIQDEFPSLEDENKELKVAKSVNRNSTTPLELPYKIQHSTSLNATSPDQTNCEIPNSEQSQNVCSGETNKNNSLFISNADSGVNSQTSTPKQMLQNKDESLNVVLKELPDKCVYPVFNTSNPQILKDIKADVILQNNDKVPLPISINMPKLNPYSSKMSPLDNSQAYVKVSHIKAALHKDNLMYSCLVKGCLFQSTKATNFSAHLQRYHPNEKWDGMCKFCKRSVINPDMENMKEMSTLQQAFSHLTNEHEINLKEIEQVDLLDKHPIKSLPLLSKHVISDKNVKDSCGRTNAQSNLQIQKKSDSPIQQRHIDRVLLLRSKIKENLTKILVAENLQNGDIHRSYTSHKEQVIQHAALPTAVNTAAIAKEDDFYLKRKSFRPILPKPCNTTEESIDTEVESTNKRSTIDVQECTLEIDHVNITQPINKSQSCIFVIDANKKHVLLDNDSSHISQTLTLSDDLQVMEDSTLIQHILNKYKIMKIKGVDKFPLYKLTQLYKCMAFDCSFSTNTALHMEKHIESHEEFSKKNYSNFNESEGKSYLECSYCFVLFKDFNFLNNHIMTSHSHCMYQCRYCYYRCISLNYMSWHQEMLHEGMKHKVLVLQISPHILDAYKLDVTPKVCPILRYQCAAKSVLSETEGCKYNTFRVEDFVKHLQLHLDICSTTELICHICLRSFNIPELLMIHYKSHKMMMLQCLYCQWGGDTREDIMKHLALQHNNKPPKAWSRELGPGLSSTQMKSVPGNLISIIDVDISLCNKEIESVNVDLSYMSREEPYMFKPAANKNCKNKCTMVVKDIIDLVSPQKRKLPESERAPPDKVSRLNSYNHVDSDSDNEALVINEDVMIDSAHTNVVLGQAENQVEHIMQDTPAQSSISMSPFERMPCYINALNRTESIGKPHVLEIITKKPVQQSKESYIENGGNSSLCSNISNVTGNLEMPSVVTADVSLVAELEPYLKINAVYNNNGQLISKPKSGTYSSVNSSVFHIIDNGTIKDDVAKNKVAADKNLSSEMIPVVGNIHNKMGVTEKVNKLSTLQAKRKFEAHSKSLSALPEPASTAVLSLVEVTNNVDFEEYLAKKNTKPVTIENMAGHCEKPGTLDSSNYVILIDDSSSDTSTSPIQSKETNITDADELADYGPYGDPNGDLYMCPRCNCYSSSSAIDMQSHLYDELKFIRWTCTHCDNSSWDIFRLNQQCKTNHPTISGNEHIKPVPFDSNVEHWVSKVLQQQKSKMSASAARSTLSENVTKIDDQANLVSSDSQKPQKSDGNFKYQCTLCEYKTKFSTNFKNHKRSHFINKPPYKCGYCDFEDIRDCRVQKHCEEKHPADTIKVVYNIWKEKDKIEPPICTSTEGNRHNESLEKSNPKDIECQEFICKYCPKRAKCISDIKKHWEQSHKGPKLCGDGKTQLGQVFAYKIATKEELFKCMICDKQGYYKDLLKHHDSTHRGQTRNVWRVAQDTAYKCTICDLIANASMMQKHSETVHRDVPQWSASACLLPSSISGETHSHSM